MNNQELRPSTVKHVSEYIDERMSGNNKQESAQRAGYSVSTSRNPSLIESTQAYAVIITEILDKNARVTQKMLNSIAEDVESGLFDELSPQIKAEIAFKLVRIHDTLTPRVTVKESTDAKGNKTRHIWGTGGAPLHENPTNEQGIE